MHPIIEPLLKSVLLLVALMIVAAYLVLLERWIAAWVQDRLGPNRVGVPLTKIRLFGLGQPIADGGKFLTKAEFSPGHVDKVMYIVGPLAIFVAALAAFAVVPLGSVILPESWGFDGPLRLSVAPGLDVGMIYIFAVGSVAVYGVVLGGWASNNKYSFFGAIRSSAQLISYEIPLGLGILGVIMVSGSLRLDSIIVEQARLGVWNAMAQPLGFVVFCVAAFAEAARLPFDLPEAEQELVGGYHTEYLGIKLIMYMVSEFLHMVLAAFLIVILFLGGWHFWGLTGSADAVSWPVALLRVIVMLAKVMGVILFFMFARWSWPRFRYDQLMDVAWKVMIPWGMINVVVVAVWMQYGRELASWLNITPASGMMAVGWGTLFLCWLATSIINPTANRTTKLDMS